MIRLESRHVLCIDLGKVESASLPGWTDDEHPPPTRRRDLRPRFKGVVASLRSDEAFDDLVTPTGWVSPLVRAPSAGEFNRWALCRQSSADFNNPKRSPATAIKRGQSPDLAERSRLDRIIQELGCPPPALRRRTDGAREVGSTSQVGHLLLGQRCRP